jgi:D-alanyl-D-alanine carboxypeptidase
VLAAARERMEAPGLAAGLRFADGVEEYAASGLARREDSLPLQPTMAFPAGSIIKPCIGALAWQLAVEGLLELDTPLRQWVPEFIGTGDMRTDSQDASTATLRQVLNHSAGIKCFTELLYWLPYPLQVHNAQRRWTDDDALAIANHYPPYFAPGTGFHYSNCGYALLGLALERAASHGLGRAVRLEELLRHWVFQPAGIAAQAGGATRYIRDDPPVPNTQALADTRWPPLELHGYMKLEHGGHNVTQYETYSLFGPAGALLSSLPDLLQLSQWLFDPRGTAGAAAHGSAEQRTTTATALLDSIPADGPGKRYGLGVQIFERDWAGGLFYGHGGNVMGTSSGMWYFPARGLHLAFVANRALAWERPVFEALLEWADHRAGTLR